MINRRDVLKSLAAAGVLSYAGAAFAQTPSKALNEKEKERVPCHDREVANKRRRMEDLLGPIRDEHHLPGLVGGITFGGNWRPWVPSASARSVRPSRSK